MVFLFFFFQAEDGIRDGTVTGVQTCALPILPVPRVTSYRLEGELESLLGRSFPLPGDADKIRGIFAASLGDDRLGIPMFRDGERIRYAYPVAVLVASKPAA